MNPLEELAETLVAKLDLHYEKRTGRGRAAGVATADDLSLSYIRETNGAEYLQLRRPGITVRTIYHDGLITSSVIRGPLGKEYLDGRYSWDKPTEAADTIADIIRPKPT